jgi:hypothetical protein
MLDPETGMPKHATPYTVHLCMDARKDNCPFYNEIIIKTECVSFDQGFCGYTFRKKECKLPYPGIND